MLMALTFCFENYRLTHSNNGRLLHLIYAFSVLLYLTLFYDPELNCLFATIVYMLSTGELNNEDRMRQFAILRMMNLI